MFKIRQYKPVCPRGYKDCIHDPAYIKYHYPTWYLDLYGMLIPSKAIYQNDGCYDLMCADPDMNFYCYDNEDK